ncbi:class I SAM-dependent methyltransferase [Ktedonosporobacter rubrisoli]|uniref:Class I SAM-dependent methyltransferase n=1 Tax=Ktedonosporobacter rubrisoli TaxID=2509675 RepID=A0A4P6JTA5_KTERU|nr:class I SAM-dependent methyltransferase [Ktedonosporobacter rubrisoli]QBD78520.1 class I SAM-dependent methyltransferase [Ktedonosporobacter rubrisoli]
MPETTGINDQNYLLTRQYNNATNLNARIQLHARFSTNKYDWQRWVFDHFHIRPESRILELGCGPGFLWRNNQDRLPSNWEITLSDFSAGMLQEAQNNLSESSHAFIFRVIDAQRIPFEDQSFDAVIANHMLYHIPDREKALSEIQRILKPGGLFYAATGGQAHLQEINALLQKISGSELWGRNNDHAFGLENGAAELSRWFTKVELTRLDGELVVTEAEPLLAYIFSGRARYHLSEQQQQMLRQIVEQTLQAQKAVRITTSSGLFEATK